MKKSKVILIIISLVCILIGAAMVTGAYFSLVNDASGQLAALEFQEKTHTGSGPILFTGMDAANLEFLSTSGDVSGNLLSPKNFITETVSGFVNVPRSDESNGTCHISTVSGNISIAIEP